MRKLLIFSLPLIIGAIQAVSRLPEVSSWLALTNSQTQYCVVILTVILLTINQFCLVHLPYKKLEKTEGTRPFILDILVDTSFGKYKERGFDLRVNVMSTKRRLLFFKEPRIKKSNKRKLTWCGKRFHFLWVSGNMNFDEDRYLALTINQGVCGETYRNKGIRTADLTVTNPETYNLCRDQLLKTKPLKFILSCPLFKFDHQDKRSTKEIMGVVNIDSKSEGSEILINNPKYLKDLTDRAEAFSDICSRIFS